MRIPWWLGYLNFLILQWLFIRLTKWEEDNQNGFGLLIGVLPLTGWWSRYIKLPIKHIKLEVNCYSILFDPLFVFTILYIILTLIMVIITAITKNMYLAIIDLILVLGLIIMDNINQSIIDK